MKLNWFIRKGIIYLPASVIGWILLTVSVAYSIFAFILISKNSDSVSDTLINTIFNLLLTGLAYTLIAYFTEKKRVPGEHSITP